MTERPPTDFWPVCPSDLIVLAPLPLPSLYQDPTATNMDECTEYVARAELEEGKLFAHQSEHASFQIVTPKATIRLSHGRLHQVATRDPTGRLDLPDHLTWQMNMAVDHNEVQCCSTCRVASRRHIFVSARFSMVETGCF